MKGHKNVFQRNGIGMQADVIILISSKRDFKLKVTRRNTDDQFILIKGQLPETYNPNLNIYTIHQALVHPVS